MTLDNAMDLKDLLDRAGAENVEIKRIPKGCAVMAFLPGTIEGQVFDKDSDLALCRSKLGYLVSLMEMKEPDA